MKKYLYLISFFFAILFSACSDQANKNPEIDFESITTSLNWGMSQDSVNKVLTEKFLFDSKKVLEQENINLKVFEYKGGNLYNINSEKWITMFREDSLSALSLNFLFESKNENEKAYKLISQQLDKIGVRDSIQVEGEKRWLLNSGSKSETGILLTINEKNFMILLYPKPEIIF
ncbi:MAG: hypothetical protein C0425_11730 [Chlorobiaceae bacterium]|nr:hypothetical protein [Chlorobiaceae bacterium]MBA4310984.1 hypothetical protein [Chlorobiaceae bacterium]